ncbi:lipoate--protein ligase family protein [Bifidobacterium tissieri]|uniref:Lipoate--protein ligase family protein n=2 Tax=Bifidobacterium tissieri TaxID=1630162 RepID=A0A5M9ZKY2_9BIFI|nr:lipoate--protein ligase family protein [Bifidobacterium tissieri]KAA8830382.1 lipoate--protein ligase family protein [Bifidobacterium tissieri]
MITTRTLTGRGECKTPSGKLVAISVRCDDDGIVEARLDGDFLIDDRGGHDCNDGRTDCHTDDHDDDDMALIADLERAITRQHMPIDTARFRSDVRQAIDAHPDSELIGTTADAIITATSRAIADARNTDADPRDTADGPAISLAVNNAGTATANSAGAATVTANTPHPAPDALSDRWRDLALYVVQDPQPYSPPMQMALDQVIAQAVAAGDQPPTLRFWNWGGPAVVIGAYQSVNGEVNEAEAAHEGFTVVRRITGGGAMFVRPDDTITYSLYVPESFTHGLDAVESYRICDEWAFSALHALGIPAVHQPINDIATPSGGKIGGAAQRRFRGTSGTPGCILHHVTMAYRIDGEAMSRILRISKEKLKYKVKAVASANKRVQPLATQTDLTRDQIIHGMADHALATIPGAQSDSIPESMLMQARSLAQTRFSDPDWTHRIP